MENRIIAMLERREHEAIEHVRLCERMLAKESDTMIRVGSIDSPNTAIIVQRAIDLAAAQAAYVNAKRAVDDALRTIRGN
jgi:hypothetical protein